MPACGLTYLLVSQLLQLVKLQFIVFKNAVKSSRFF